MQREMRLLSRNKHFFISELVDYKAFASARALFFLGNFKIKAEEQNGIILLIIALQLGLI